MEQFEILIDTHVHIYDCYDIKTLFSSAIKNLTNESKKFEADRFIGVLYLTETADDNYFRKLKENSYNNELGELHLKPVKNQEDLSLVYQYNNNYLVVISGKQIITSEKIEVLALGTIEDLAYGENLKRSLEKIKAVSAIPVLPWGVGKWTGKRGKIIRSFLDNNEDLKYFLGDNSGRPIFWLTPKLFEFARNKGIVTLRGSDPLPLQTQEEKAGSFGFHIRENLDLNYPARDINRLILGFNEAPRNFGKLEGALDFFKNQLSMQLRKLK